MELEDRLQIVWRYLKAQALILGGFVIVIWLLEVLDWLLLGHALDGFGIRPRTWVGLWGIPLAPVLHGGFRHLAANTLPFLILGWLVMVRDMRHFFVVSTVAVLVSGMGTWLLGSTNSVHLGASGLIFGYFGFLLLFGYFQRSPAAVLWSVGVAILYGGLVFGLLPQGRGISWQSHLFGFVGGALAAYLLADRRQVTVQEY